MKKTIVVVAALMLSLGVKAQSLEEGIKMYNYERYASAHKALEGQAGSNALANYYLGLAQLEEGNTDAAKATFGKYPEDAANKAGMARAAFAQKNAAEGNRIAAEVASMAKKKNWEPLLYAADAVTYTKGGDYMQAISWYKKGLESSADNPNLLIGLGDAYRQLARTGKISSSGEAMTAYEKATGKDPNNSLAYSRIGKLWYDARNYPLALENYEKAKNADPSNPLPYGDLADAYYFSNNLAKAKENIEKYRELSDKSPEVEERYLYILYLSGDHANAIKQAENLIGSGKAKPGFYGIIAYSNLEMPAGDSVKAMEYAKRYFAMQDPEKIKADDYLKYGMIAAKLGQDDTANFYFNKYEATDTVAVNKLANTRKIAELYKNRKVYTTSADWYGKVVATGSGTANDYFYWGYYNFVNSYNLATAVKAFDEMQTKFPDQPTAFYYAGRVGAGIDSNAKTGAGLKHYEKWLAIPDNDKYTKKKADLMNAYQYMAAYYYNNNDKANMDKYVSEIEKLEPGNAFAAQMRTNAKSMK